jgi:hypothetical protein
MKTIALMFIAAALVLAQDKKAAAPRTPAKDPAALPTVPEGAKQVAPYLFRYTDAQGKTWMYRQTPFGVSKWEDKPSEQQPASVDTVPTTVKDLGDSVQFQRLTPFGPAKWVRKKSELTDDEKAILARQEGAKSSTESSKPAKTTEKQ